MGSPHFASQGPEMNALLCQIHSPPFPQFGTAISTRYFRRRYKLCCLPVAWRNWYVEASISIQEGRMRTIQFNSFLVNNKHGDLSTIFARVENLRQEKKKSEILLLFWLPTTTVNKNWRWSLPWCPMGKTSWAICTNCTGHAQSCPSPTWLLRSSGRCIKMRQYKG